MTKRNKPANADRSKSVLPNRPSGNEADLAEIVRLVFGVAKNKDLKVPQPAIEAVEEHVRHLADDVLSELNNRTSAPKLRDEVERLNAIVEPAHELQQKLNHMDAITRDLIAGNLQSMQKPFRLVEPQPAPVPSADLAANLVAWSAGPVHPLTALARASESTRQFILERTSARSGSGMTTGASNLHRHLLGNLRRHLAYEAAQLLGGIQGAEAVGATPSGKLYRLTVALWKFATGLDMDATGGAALTRILKEVAPLARGVLHEKASLETSEDKAAVLKRLILVEAEAREKLRRPPVRPSRRRSG